MRIVSTWCDCGVWISRMDIFIICLEGGSIISFISWISSGSDAVACLCTSTASLFATSASLFVRRMMWRTRDSGLDAEQVNREITIATEAKLDKITNVTTALWRSTLRWHRAEVMRTDILKHTHKQTHIHIYTCNGRQMPKSAEPCQLSQQNADMHKKC